MAIPDFQTVMLPLLKTLEDGEERSIKDVTNLLAARYELTEEERFARLPSGQQSIISNRVAWAKTHLKAAGLVESPKRGRVRITELGRTVITQNPPIVNLKYLQQYPAYLEFRERSSEKEETSGESQDTEPVETGTPLELLDASYKTLRQAVKEELLTRLKECSPAFFERAVLKLLLAMGYGGVAGSGEVTGQSGDGGIDGIIKEDKLGLDVVCIQAKRWDNNPVGRPKVQEFVGSMDFVRAKKGVIITTSTFTKDARNFVERIEAKKVVLIDGETLSDLMINHNVGVTTTGTYELKEVSNDFFNEDEE